MVRCGVAMLRTMSPLETISTSHLSANVLHCGVDRICGVNRCHARMTSHVASQPWSLHLLRAADVQLRLSGRSLLFVAPLAASLAHHDDPQRNALHEEEPHLRNAYMRAPSHSGVNRLSVCLSLSPSLSLSLSLCLYIYIYI